MLTHKTGGVVANSVFDISVKNGFIAINSTQEKLEENQAMVVFVPAITPTTVGMLLI